MRIAGYLTLLILVACVSVFIGVKDISVWDIFNPDEEQALILTVSRIPRTLSLILAGIGLSISGLILQQITQNKFVSPTTAGTLDAAKLGLLIAFLWIPQAGLFNRALLAFVFTFAASLVFLNITDRIRHRNIIFVPLVGILFGNILSSVSSFFAYRNNIVQNVNAWLVGDFSSVLKGNYEVLFLSVPAIFITYLYANKFTVVGMGEAFSRNLGLNYRQVVNIGLFCVSVTVSVVVITVGAIPFLGLVVPNIISLMYGDNLRKTLPYTALFGALFLLVCDIAGRLILFPFEVPIGVVVGVVGGVLFLILLFRRR
ncbi:MAG: iron chelate uptake ABC transporter family permease subunit [Leadbetterella sp.]|nr:iron chelate uptake ABC transporter family permease subunit [Leadbetterella sp.]